MIEIEEQVRRYAVDVAGPPLGGSPADLAQAGRARRRGSRWVLAAALALFVTGAGLVVARVSNDTASGPVATDPTTSDPATTSSVVAEARTQPYALPPETADVAGVLVDGDRYVFRYSVGADEFRLSRYAPGSVPSTPMTSDDLDRLMASNQDSPELRQLSLPGFESVYIQCGGGLQSAPSLGVSAFDFTASATAFWIQDEHEMSLSLVGEPPERGRASDGSAATCPRSADVDLLEQALLIIRPVGRSQLDAAIDSTPLTLGRYGRAIDPPR